MNNRAPGDQWTAEQQATMVELAAAGDTAAQIGVKLDKSRSAILGRAHRTGIKLKGGSNGRPHGGDRRSPAVTRGRHQASIDRQSEMRLKRRADWSPEDLARENAKEYRARSRVRAAAAMNPTPFMHAVVGTRAEPGQCRYPLWGDDRIPIAEKMVCGGVGYPWCTFHKGVVMGGANG